MYGYFRGMMFESFLLSLAFECLRCPPFMSRAVMVDCAYRAPGADSFFVDGVDDRMTRFGVIDERLSMHGLMYASDAI